MKTTISGVFFYFSAMLLIAFSNSSFADVCPKGSLLPVPDNVKQFQQQVRASLRAALRGKSDALVLSEIRDVGSNLSADARYCAKGDGPPLAITVEARFEGAISLDDGKKAMGLIDLRDREKESILNTPAPAHLLEESKRFLAEREELRAQRPTNRYAPGYNEVGEKMQQLQLKSEQVLKPHKEAMEKRVRDEVDVKYQADIDKLTYRPSGRIEISANNYDFQRPPTILIGTKGKTNTITTSVKKVAIDINVGTTNPAIVKLMNDAASPLIDRARLQSLVDGKIPSVEESNALFAQQAEDMKTGKAQLTEANKAYAAVEADARRARQAERSGKPVNNAATSTATPATTVTQTQNTNASNQNQQPAQAQPTQQAQQQVQPAPQQQTPSITPTNITNGLNQLKGLFGR